MIFLQECWEMEPDITKTARNSAARIWGRHRYRGCSRAQNSPGIPWCPKNSRQQRCSPRSWRRLAMR